MWHRIAATDARHPLVRCLLFIVTGGPSDAWESDAVGGVVNRFRDPSTRASLSVPAPGAASWRTDIETHSRRRVDRLVGRGDPAHGLLPARVQQLLGANSPEAAKQEASDATRSFSG
jgi:hypothetical protein